MKIIKMTSKTKSDASKIIADKILKNKELMGVKIPIIIELLDYKISVIAKVIKVNNSLIK
jgi:hypothetical protein